MRVPTKVTRCKVASGAAAALMVAGSVADSQMVRAWSILVAIHATGLALAIAIRRGTEAIKAYIHQWSLDTFEHGFKQGVEQGREMEAAERMIAIARNYREP